MIALHRGRLVLAGSIVALTVLSGSTSAQIASPQTFDLRYDHDSGFVEN